MPREPNRWSIEQDIYERALRSRGELRKLEHDPKGALERALGEPLPPEIEVRVAFDSRHKLHQVVPFTGHAMLGSIAPPKGDEAIPALRGLSVEAAERMVRDPEFRDRLLADPTGFARFGLHTLPFPEDVEVEVLTEDAQTIWLVVPLFDRRIMRRGRGRDRHRRHDR
ncbi:MAG: hypothetical protein KC636_01120 [Myxococcales bacterium]|nr:hypothetical protein [Myxococcales bacterium]